MQANGEDPAWYGQPALARINATSPELLRAFAKLNAGKAYADRVKPFNFLSFAPGAQPPADQNPAHFRLVAPYGTASERRKAVWVNVHKPDETYRLHRPDTARHRDRRQPPTPRRALLQPPGEQVRR